MKFGYYVVYGVGKPFSSFDAMKKAWEDFAKFLKKHKMELIFWGAPIGATEDAMYVMKGNVEDFQSLFDYFADYMKAIPIASGHRTNMVLVP